MTGAVLDRPCATTAASVGVARSPVTLRELLDRTLDEARANGSSACPVCDARMTYARAGAECTGCGSRLS